MKNMPAGGHAPPCFDDSKIHADETDDRPIALRPRIV
jgi:hypothetical protein